jgi:thioredoxin reductase (NADPH)
MTHAPVLTDAQIRRIRRVSKLRQVKAGQVLYQPNDETPAVYIVLSGGVRISAISAGQQHELITYLERQFSGDLLMISGRRSIYRCEAIADGSLLELEATALCSLINKDSELGDVFMNAFLARRALFRESGKGNVVVVGSKYSTETFSIREFLARDGHPFSYFDIETDTVSQELLDHFDTGIDHIPVVICNDEVLRRPSVRLIAETLGFNSEVEDTLPKDLVIVGAGPAGLAAAVYAASEGLRVLVVEKMAPGGQAGSSSKIENYLGFPTGISGQELMGRAIAQAEKFGARIVVARTVSQLHCDDRPYRVTLDDGQEIQTRSIILATGAQYNRPALTNLNEFAGCGIYYNATSMEADLCSEEHVIVVGGGNSAGQAAVFLAQKTSGVTMLVRSNTLADTMSRYLVQRIEENPNIHVRYCTELTALHGEAHLETVTWADKYSGQEMTRPIRHVFVMAGASPKTAWLSGCLALDNDGFVLTGLDLEHLSPPVPWPLQRAPYMLETSLPGVFAVGDVRSGNVKRVASAVGEGSMVVHLVHRALAEP